jgi:hypothetical protein
MAPDVDPNSLDSELQPLLCSRCGRPVHPGRGDYYLVRIEAVADPAPPIFSEEDLAIDFDEEFEKLVEQTRDLTVTEAMNQVHRRVILNLCVSCYVRWIENPAGV